MITVSLMPKQAEQGLLAAIAEGNVRGRRSPTMSIDPSTHAVVHGAPVWSYWRTDVTRRAGVTVRINRLIDRGLATRQESGGECLVTLTEAFPQRSTCEHCKKVIGRDRSGETWGRAKVGVPGRDPHCPAAPNPDEGQAPGHRPGRVLTPPNGVR